jgi:hypothetical protein
MKTLGTKILTALALLALVAACSVIVPSAPTLPGVPILYAQTFPSSHTLVWTPPPANGDSYIVKLDGVTVGTPTVPTQVITIPTSGPHVITVQSVSVIWGAGGIGTYNFAASVPVAPTAFGFTS